MAMGGYDDDDLNGVETAFLDEVPSPAPPSRTAADSPVTKMRQVSPLQTTNAAAGAVPTVAGRKRKSDVMGDLEGAFGAASFSDMRTANEAASSKVKRRKD